MGENKSVATRLHPFFELERWRPWENLGSIGDAFPDTARRFTGATPPVDISENDERYLFRAELAGVDKSDVTVELEEGILTIRGEKKSRREEKDERGRHLECSYGSFSRGFNLPQDADPDRISAEFRDGVLEVEVAKRPESKPKQIAVKF